MFNRVVKAIRENSFYQNVLVALFGSSSAYIIGFLMTPVIARIYGPESYGLFAIVNAAVVNLTALSTLNYTNAILLPDKRRDLYDLVSLTILLSLISSLVCWCFLLVFQNQILDFFDNMLFNQVLFWIPLMVLLQSLFLIIEFLNLKYKEFGRSAKSKIFSILFSKSITLAYGYFTKGNPYGLLIGEYSIKPVSIFLLTSRKLLSSLVVIFKTFSIKRMYKIAQDYKNYPIYNLPGTWVLLLSNQAPIYFITTFYAIASVGHYSIAMSLLNVPLQMIGLAIAKVYFQNLNEIKNNENVSIQSNFLKFFKQISLVSVLPFAVLSAFGEKIFPIIVGGGWEQASGFIKYLAPAYMMQFVCLPLSSVFRIFRKERLQFYLDLINAAIIIILLMLNIFYDGTVQDLVMLLSLGICIGQMIYLILSFITVKINPIRHIIFYLGTLIGVFMAMQLLKEIIFS